MPLQALFFDNVFSAHYSIVTMQRNHSAHFSFTVFLLFLLTAGTSSVFAQEKAPPSGSHAFIPGQVRVKIKKGIELEPTVFGDAVARFGIQSMRSWLNQDLLDFVDRRTGLYRRNPNGFEPRALSLKRIVIVEYTSQDSPETVARILAEIPEVEYAEPVWSHQLLYVPNDPEIANNNQWHLERIKAFDAWDKVRADNTLVIAITDTGIEREHPDLKEAIWQNPGETGDGKESNGIDDDNNGFVDDWWGYDFAGTDGKSPDNDPSVELNDHGVHVAGIAAATGNNDIGVAGVGFGAQLMIIKIGDGKAQPSLPGGFDGILYAAAMGADVINCSWGAPRSSLAEQEVIDLVVLELGILVVAAAGNDANEALRYPAGYDHVLSVAATTSSDRKWSGSNYSFHMDISAPGAGIYSTSNNSGYKYDNGTSMAAPMVSSAAGLLLKQNPTLTPEQLTQILRATTDNIDLAAGLEFAGKLGAGRLNLDKAVNNSSLTSAKMLEYEIEDESGDGILDPGERVLLRLTVKNVLAPSNGVTTSLQPVEPESLPIENSLVDFGALATGGTAVSSGESFAFTVPEGAQPDSRIVLKVVTTTEEDSRPNNDYIVLPVYSTYATTQLHNIAVTFNSVGNLAYNGMNREQGIGFYYGSAGSLLFHGGLMVGNSPTSVVDVVRRGPTSEGTDNGFRIIEPYRLTRSPDNSVETGEALFDDRLEKIGVEVAMTTYEFKDDPNYVLVRYDVTNTSGVQIDNLHCGLYLDWDLQLNGLDDRASWDEDLNLGVVQNRNNSDILIGTTLLSDQSPDYYALDNLTEGVRSDFPDSAKWRMLSNGVSRPITPQDIDVGMVIGGGPVSIEPGKSESFGFGFIVAEDLAALREATGRAQTRYSGISSTPETGDGYSLVSLNIRPNPVSSETQLSLEMPATEFVKLRVYDAQGRIVRSLHEGRLEQGNHAFRFDVDDLPSGIYIYEAQGESVRARGRMIVTK